MRFLVLIFLLSSCSSYKNSFDCPPPKGVSCLSVSEIEGMIVENEVGEDTFFPEQNSKCKCNEKKVLFSEQKSSCRCK